MFRRFAKFFSSTTRPPGIKNGVQSQIKRRPGDQDTLNLYKVLGLRKSASLKQIKQTYYDLAKKYHPDTSSSNPESSRKFQQITEAYEVLSDEVKRAEYDQFGTVSGLASVKSRVLNNVMRRSDYVLRNIFKNTAIRPGLTEIDEDPEKIFDQEIPVTISFQESISGGRRDILIPVRVKCEKCQECGLFTSNNPEACKVCSGSGVQTIKTDDSEMQVPCKFCGGTKIQFCVPCPECDGKGHVVRRQQVFFDIPKLTQEGDKLEVRHPSRRKLITVKFKVGNDAHFVLEGYDIVSYVDVPFTKALLGIRTVN